MKLTIRIEPKWHLLPTHPPHPFHLAISDFLLNTLFSILSIMVKKVLESDLP